MAKRKYESYKSDKRYNPTEIGTLLGLGTVDRKPKEAATPPGQSPVKNWSDDWGKSEGTKTSKYKDGDKKTNKDGDHLIYKGGRWVEDK